MAINFEFKYNTVDPNTQVKFPYYMDGVKKEEATFRVMFIGNSITYHELKPDIGWTRQCGMAASDLEHDYVHLVLNELTNKYGKVSACVFNGGRWEMDYTNESKIQTIISTIEEFKPDLCIVRIGENMSNPYNETKIDPTPYFNKLVKGAKENSKQIIVTSLFWENSNLEPAIQYAAKENNVKYIVLNDLGNEDKYKAIGLFEHRGVAGHPGDLGMQEIANRILKAIN